MAAKNKTQPRKTSVDAFLAGIEHDRRREDCTHVVDLMTQITGEPPQMWGSSIIGFGTYHYVYESGREGDMCMVGVSPRKQSLVLYVMPGFSAYEGLMAKLGKHKIGKSCLYINKLADVDLAVLKRLIRESFRAMKRKYA